jgi:lipoprotein signal peptidase
MSELETTSEGRQGDDTSGPPAESPGTDPAPIVAAPKYHPSYVFLAVVSAVSLAADLGTKLWAEKRLDGPDAYFHPVVLIKDHLDFVLAKNRGGAWGLLQDTPEYVRRPFFLLVSALAITFIVSLYRRLAPNQRALKWGLPLVLGGALGNLVDRIRYSHVIDFIHAHAKWGGRDHSWPTFNVADIAICVGVGLMAIDMFAGNKTKPRTSDAP